MINEEILGIISKDYVYSVAGKCNGCQLCEYLAVDNFSKRRDNNGFEVVKQPVSWEEKEQCQEAMERCPLHGIERSEVAVPHCER